MSACYVDTSWLLAIFFGEEGSKQASNKLLKCDYLFSSNLLEAELLAACAREKVIWKNQVFFDRINWVLPERPISEEIRRILEVCYVKGADLWHIACACYQKKYIDELQFMSLDKKQRDAAKNAGLKVLEP